MSREEGSKKKNDVLPIGGTFADNAGLSDNSVILPQLEREGP